MPDPFLTDEEAMGTPAPAVAPVPQPLPAPAPEPAPVDLTDAEAMGTRDDRDRLSAVVGSGLEQDPARSAKILALQARTGLPTDLIARRFDAVQSAARRADFDPDAFRRTSPVVADWLAQDPARVGLTRDDLPQWAAIEALVRASPDYAYAPNGAIRETDRATGSTRLYRNPGELRDALRERGFAADIAQARAEAVEYRLRDSYGPFANIVAGLTADVGETAVAAGRLVGHDAAATRENAEAVSEASQAISPGFGGSLQRGVGGLVAQVPLLLLGGVVTKAAQGLGEAMSLGSTLTPILGARATALAGKAALGAAGMQPFAVRGALTDQQGAGHALTSWAIDSAIAGAFGPIGAQRAAAKAAGVALAPTEAESSAARFLLTHAGLAASENATFDLAHRLHDVASGSDPTALDAHNLLPSLALSGLLGAGAAAVFSAPEAVELARTMRERAGRVQVNRMAQAMHAREILGATADLAGETQAMHLNQDAAKSLLQSLAGETPYRTLYVDSHAWAEHFSPAAGGQKPPAEAIAGDGGKSPVDARQLAADATGDPVAYDKALSAGGQIAVPYERFLPLLNDATHRDWLLDEARTAPDAMNGREARGAVEQAKGVAEEQARAAGPDSPEAQRAASADLVHESVKQQLLAAGRPETEAERSAQLWRAIFHTASGRGWTDLAPHELYEQAKIRIQRSLGGPQARDALDAMIARLKAGDIPSENDIARAMEKPDKRAGSGDIIDTVRELGGIAHRTKADTGGEHDDRSPSRLINGDVAPDVMAARLASEHGIGDGTPQAMWRLIDAAEKARKDAKEPRETEDSARIRQTRDRLLGMLEHLQALGADVSAETTERLKARILAVDRDAAEPDAGEALTQAPRGTFTSRETEARDRFSTYLAGHEAEAIRRYNELPGTHGGKVIAADEAKLLSEDFVRDGTLANAVHDASSAFAEMLYRRALASGEHPGPVLFMAGGAGSGKTTAIERAGLMERAGLVFDSTLSDAAKARERVDQALAAGREAVIGYVHAPIETAVGRIVDRALATGRALPLGEAADKHLQAQRTIIGLADELRDNPHVTVMVADNAGSVDAIALKSVDWLRSQEYASGDDVRDRARTAYAAQRGRVDDAYHAALAGDLAEPRGARAVLGGSAGEEPAREPRGEGRSLEQTGAGDEPRGSYLPRRLSAQGENLIRLMKGADRSTFLHESAHFLLEMLHDLAAGDGAPEMLKADLGQIRDWLGAKPGEEITRAQHEAFARGFEAYVMEGKAPSAGLRGAFERFKRWLVAIYRDVSSLRVHLSDEVRAVFDRILATDEEIARARAEANVDGVIFADQAESGMNDQQWQRYTENRQKGLDVARQLLEREVMEPLLREEQKAYQEERARTRLAVANEINQRPVYTALLVLQKGAWPEGVEIPEGSERLKLDKRDLIARYGAAALDMLPGPAVGGKEGPNRGRRLYAEEGGISLDEASQIFGFPDGGQLWEALVNAPDRTAEIERQTDDALRAAGRNPDPLLDGTLVDKARAAVENDPRFDVLEREAAALALRTGKPATPAQLLKAIALAQIGKTRARDLRPALYRVAKERASRAAVVAITEARHATDPKEKARFNDEALKQKQNELLQAHLFRVAAAAVERSEKQRAFVQSFDDLDKRQKIGKAGGWEWTVSYPGAEGQAESRAFASSDHGDDPAKAQDAAVAFARTKVGADVERSGYLEQIDAVREGYDLKRASNAALQRREALRDFIARKAADGFAVQVPEEVVADLGKRNWRDLTVDEQKAVVDALKNLQKLAYYKNDLYQAQKRETFRQMRDGNIAAMEANSNGVRRDHVVGRQLTDTVTDTIGRWWSSMATVGRLAREMDGGGDGGAMFETWLRPINEAKARELEMGERNIAAMAELVKQWGKITPGGIGISVPRHEPAIGQSISHWGRIMVALNWGNAGNRERLLEGHGWTAPQVEAVIAKLDRADMRFVQGILAHINSFWPEIKSKVERVTGIAPEKVEAVPIIHHSGVYEGGYFPVAYDPKYPTKGRDVITDEQATLQRQGARLFAVTKHGHEEARTGLPEGARLLLDPSVITRHLDTVAHDLAYHETILDLNRLLRDREWRETMLAHWGVDAYRQFQSRLAAIAVGQQMPQLGWEKLLAWGRQGVNFANRAINLHFALMQVPGILQSIPRVGAKYFAKGLIGLFRSPGATDGSFAWMRAQSAEFRNRAKLRDKNIADRLVGVSLRGPVRQTIDAVGYYFFNKVNELLDGHTFMSSYLKAMDEQGGDHAKAIAIADQTVVDIQGSGDVKDIPAAMRGGELGQVFTASMSWWLANYNLTAETVNRGVRGARRGDLAAVLKTGADLFCLYGIQAAAMSALAYALTGEHQKEWESALDEPGELAKSLMADATFTGLSSMVLVRELAGAVKEGTRYRGPQGLRSMGLLAEAIAAVRDNNQDAGEAKSLARAAGVIFHLPVAQLVSTAEGVADAQTSGGNPLWRALFGKPRE